MLRRISLTPVLVIAVMVIAACSPGAEPVTTTVAPVTSATEPVAEGTTTSSTAETTSTPSTTVPLAELQGLSYTVVADGLDFSIILMPWTDDASLVGFRDGRVHAFDGATISSEPLFDLDVSTDGERGLLGLDAVDADSVYVHYSDPAGDTVVSEITVSTGVERVLLTVSQPAANHNGGMLQFGPDDGLYLGLGDGGGSNDPFGHGQNTDTLLGGIVSIDPESGDSRLWSYGLRNPYRFWFDGDALYIGDVGQGSYEEIDVVGFAQEGFNFRMADHGGAPLLLAPFRM